MPTRAATPAWEGARNLSDLGGLPRRDGGTTRTGVVWRSAAPDSMTATGWASAVRDGLRAVVDLRNEAERRLDRPCVPAPTALVVAHTPTEDPDDAAYLAECGRWLDHPRAWAPTMRRFPHLVAAALRAVGDADGPVLVHCAGGRDRTGLVCSLLLALAGATPDAIAAAYEAGFRGAADHPGHGLAYDATRGAWVPARNAPEGSVHDLDRAVAARLPALRAWLTTTDAVAYAAHAGLDAAQIRRLCDLLR